MKQLFYICSLLMMLSLSSCTQEPESKQPDLPEATQEQDVAKQKKSTKTTPVQEVAPEKAPAPAQHEAIYLHKIASGAQGKSKLKELLAQGNVVIDFFAPWCPPCKKLSPIIDALAKEYGDTVTFIKVDTEQFPDIARGFDQIEAVSAIPQLYFYKDGTKVHHVKGLLDKASLQNSIKSLFKV